MASLRTGLLALAAACALFGATSGPAAARPLALGFADSVFLTSAGESSPWLDRSVSAGAQVIRVTPSWSSIAPATRPAGFDPADPADPAYDWAGLDSAVRGAGDRGLRVLVTLYGAPKWAEGPHRPSRAVSGSWRPSATALGAFARAAALRYSGSFADPERPGQMLPRVRLWQVWNEPNLDTYVAPQWVRSHGHYVPFAPGRYREMLNAAYRAIKAVHGDNVVGTAGTAPYGDPRAGGHRIAPVTFDRLLMAKRTSFDALSHHPYGVRGPNSHALNRNDVAVPDLGKLTRVVRAAQRRGTVSRGRKRLWVTEVSWDSNPPDPNGVPAARQARWLAEAFYVLWRQGVETITWFQIRDEDATGGYAFSNQSGVYLRGGRAKPSLAAFRFPFVVERSGERAIIWGLAPASGPVEIERRSGSTWVRVATVAATEGTPFRRMQALGNGTYRAVQGGRSSRAWAYTR